MKQTYDVALWQYWLANTFPFTDFVEAESPLLAVLSLMQTHALKHVAYAAVRLPDGTFERWQIGVSLYTPPTDEPDERRS